MADKAYTVGKIEPWTSLDVKGNPYETYRITFTTNLGDVGYVDMARDGFTKEAASEAVAAEAAKLIAVRSL